jgi:NAD(P)-dependent dehydrogenase (short-subunit alcohol dehydrogenase family)
MSDSATTPVPPETEGRAPGRERLTGRRILVVGAGTTPVEGYEGGVGNGRAIAILAAREGARVACGDRDEEAAAATVAAVADEHGEALAVVGDVTHPDACRKIVGDAERALGGLDGLVLNVGTLAPSGLAATDSKAWDRVFATNTRSHALIAAEALPLLARGGSIVFISSISGLVPGIRMPAYDSSKAAVLALARHTALEGSARGIRANAVLPGVVDTPFGFASAPRGGRDRGRIPLPLGRRGTPWDVAHAVVFLLSGEAAYITAQSLVVDGGTTVLFAGA